CEPPPVISGRAAGQGFSYPTVVYRGLNLHQVELRPALQRTAAPLIGAPLEPAQAIHHEAHPMRPTQGHTAIFEGKDAAPAVLITAERMRSEAHPELNMESAQACPVLDRAPDHG